MKTLAIMALFAALPALTDCPDKKRTPVAVSEACAVIKKTLYPNCRLRFSPEEVAALSDENQTKITAVKLFFRQCPEAKVCAAK
jgi:hypothetical protein